MKIQYARSKLKCIKLNLDTAENGENKNYINNNIHTFNLLLMVSHFCDFGARLWKFCSSKSMLLFRVCRRIV